MNKSERSEKNKETEKKEQGGEILQNSAKVHDERALTALSKGFSIFSYWEGRKARGESCSRYVISVQLHWQMISDIVLFTHTHKPESE